MAAGDHAGQRITFRTVNGSVKSVTCMRGEAPPKLTDGFGGWEVQDRPKLVGATLWKGKSPLAMDIPVIFDGWVDLEPVEDDITRITHMAWPPKPHAEPPKVKVGGGTPGDTYTWVISDITWGDEQIWAWYRGSMVRYRQDAVIKLLQHVDIAKVKAMRPMVAGAGATHVKFYRVKKGDTLPKIAVKVYGDRSKWKNIAKANKIRDGQKLVVGRQLRIP